MPAVIETVDLTRRFGKLDAVDGLNLQVPAGSLFAFVGPNGAGKTTTIKILLNLLRPTSGEAFVLGTDSRSIGPRELARIGYVSENQDLPDWMTIEALIAYVRPLYPTWDEKLCRKLQRDLDLTSRLPVRLFSRGMRMKAALLVSLAYRPELVVLDEPFSGLDPLARDELVRALLELTGERTWTTLISSHDIDEVERLADSIAFINQGRIFLTESVQELIGKYRRPLRDIFVMLARESREHAAVAEAV
jgi:ABC-2 type transport system ATP-binding protein